MPAKRPKPECRTSVVGHGQLCFQQKAFSEHVTPHAIPCLHHNTVTKVSFENILCMSTLVERKINVDNVDEGARKPVENA